MNDNVHIGKNWRQATRECYKFTTNSLMLQVYNLPLDVTTNPLMLQVYNQPIDVTTNPLILQPTR